MPFITEELWQALPHTHQALISAPWPATGLHIDSQSTDQFESLQAVVRSIRNARAEYLVEPGRRIAATILVESSELRNALSCEKEVMALLGRLEATQLYFNSISSSKSDDDSKSSSSSSIELVVGEGLEVVLPMAGLFDATKEIERLQKQADKLEKELAALNGRLSNSTFVDKAPEKVVNEVKAAAAEATEQLSAIKEKIAKFEAFA